MTMGGGRVEDPETSRQTDRDIIVDVRRTVLDLKEGVEKLEARLDVRFEQIEARSEARFERMDKRIDGITTDMVKLQGDMARQQGGIGFGRWIVGAMASLPFLGGLIGYFVAERG